MVAIKFLILIFVGLITNVALCDQRLTLDQFLNEVRSQNLSLKAESATTHAAQSAAVGLLIPPPMAGITQMNDINGSRNGFEVSQTIPFPTKLTNDHSARKFEAEAQLSINKSKEKEVLAQAKFIYFRIWQSQERIKLLQEKKMALQEHLRLSTASARSDSFMKIHLLKTESDMDLLENERLEAEQEHIERIAEAAILINREQKDFLPVVEDINMSSLPQENSLSTPYSLDAKRFEVEALRARERAAKAEWLPDFNFKYKQTDGNEMAPKYSEVMVSASLPFVFFWERNAQAEKSSSERIRAEALLSFEKRKVDSDRLKLYSKAQTLKKQIDQLKDKIIPRAEKRVRLVHNLAPRDLETLQDHRETMEALPELKIKVLELRAQYEETVSELEKLASEMR